MAKPAITTDRQLSALRPGPKPYEVPVGDTRGLAVRVFPTGTKSFEFRYVALNGVRRRLPLGNYPGLSLAKAREDAAEHGVAVTRGGDPAAERAAKKAAARTGDTLRELAEAYFTAAAKGLHGGRGRPKRPLTLKVERNRFENHIAQRLGDRRFKDISRADVKGLMRELASTAGLAADTVASVGGTLSAILAFAVHEERIDANPATGVTRPLALRSRDRLFDDEAIGTLWRALEAVSTAPQPSRLQKAKRPSSPAGAASRASADLSVALALRFAVMTLARRNDVASARWSEIDLDRGVWTIPAERFKGGRAHVVPLSAPALGVLAEAEKLPGGGGVVVFPSPLHPDPTPEDPPRPILAGALTRALTRTLVDLKQPHGSPHDFRRAGATTLTGERYGFRRFVVGKVLGHSVQDGAAVTSVYDRNEYLSDKRAALEAWGGHVLEVAKGLKQPSNIVSIRAANGQ